MNITVLGAGNWGTTMALVLHRKGHQITLWEFDPQQAELLARTHRNDKFLPGFSLPEDMHATSDVQAAIRDAQMILLAVPAQTCRAVLHGVGKLNGGIPLISLMKGVERDTLNRISEICAQELAGFDPGCYAVISGPTIAPEVASGMPTSAVVASLTQQTAQQVQHEFSTRELRLYTSDDVVGVELAGALKNVIALAAGICDGLDLGFNAKGTLLTRGLTEITRLGTAMGGNRHTFGGLSGMGDLVTTCTSPQSRNHTVGERIGKGETLDHILSDMVMVAEGVWTARAANDLAHRYGVEMPITAAVCDILDHGKDPRLAVGELMQRSLKAED
ncbi:MAG TPA: NAD(P)H-dependent glycerol-3-phosphate dehydrogenase [bacterium]